MALDQCDFCSDPCAIQQLALGNQTFKQSVLLTLCGLLTNAEETVGRTQEFTMDLAQVAGTYDLFTASGNVVIDRIDFYNAVAGAGLTSVSSATNDGTPTTLLSSVLLAALTGGVSLTPYTTPFVLGDGKKGRYTIVGTGTAGTIIAIVKYRGAGTLS